LVAEADAGKILHAPSLLLTEVRRSDGACKILPASASATNGEGPSSQRAAN